jgi:hypothetical protein
VAKKRKGKKYKQPKPMVILSAEHVGMAHTVDGILDVGGVEIPYVENSHTGNVAVYVRRSSHDLSVMEICIARHDGLAQEELERQNEEAHAHPAGPREYWRGVMVGKYTNGPDGHLLTDEEFDADWDEMGF